MRSVLSLLFLFLTLNTYSQPSKNYRLNGYAGFGAGLDFGGLGIRGEHIPADWVGLFAGVGYNFSGFGWNTGVNLKFTPEAKATPFLTAMFGYNTVLLIEASGEEYVNVYYGISAGGGIDIFMGKNRNKLSVGALVPFRGEKYKSELDYFRQRRFTITDPLPVLFSIGFHFAHYTRKPKPSSR